MEKRIEINDYLTVLFDNNYTKHKCSFWLFPVLHKAQCKTKSEEFKRIKLVDLNRIDEDLKNKNNIYSQSLYFVKQGFNSYSDDSANIRFNWNLLFSKSIFKFLLFLVYCFFTIIASPFRFLFLKTSKTNEPSKNIKKQLFFSILNSLLIISSSVCCFFFCNNLPRNKEQHICSFYNEQALQQSYSAYGIIQPFNYPFDSFADNGYTIEHLQTSEYESIESFHLYSKSKEYNPFFIYKPNLEIYEEPINMVGCGFKRLEKLGASVVYGTIDDDESLNTAAITSSSYNYLIENGLVSRKENEFSPFDLELYLGTYSSSRIFKIVAIVSDSSSIGDLFGDELLFFLNEKTMNYGYNGGRFCFIFSTDSKMKSFLTKTDTLSKMYGWSMMFFDNNDNCIENYRLSISSYYSGIYYLVLILLFASIILALLHTFIGHLIIKKYRTFFCEKIVTSKVTLISRLIAPVLGFLLLVPFNISLTTLFSVSAISINSIFVPIIIFCLLFFFTTFIERRKH